MIFKLDSFWNHPDALQLRLTQNYSCFVRVPEWTGPNLEPHRQAIFEHNTLRKKTVITFIYKTIKNNYLTKKKKVAYSRLTFPNSGHPNSESLAQESLQKLLFALHSLIELVHVQYTHILVIIIAQHGKHSTYRFKCLNRFSCVLVRLTIKVNEWK